MHAGESCSVVTPMRCEVVGWMKNNAVFYYGRRESSRVASRACD